MTLERILRIVIFSGIFSLPFLVFYVAGDLFFPYITGKNFAFRAIVEVITVAWLLLTLLSSEYRPRKSVVYLSLGVFIVIVALADLLGPNPFKSIWSNYERMEGLVTLLHLGAFSLVAGTMFKTQQQWNYFWATSIGVSTVVSITALAQLGEKARLDSTLGNPIYLAVYVLFHIFILVTLLVRRGANQLIWIFAAPIIILESVVLYFTATRGATLGLIGGVLLALLGIALSEQRRKHIRYVAMAVNFPFSVRNIKSLWSIRCTGLFVGISTVFSPYTL
jgi:hypothetical protein